MPKKRKSYKSRLDGLTDFEKEAVARLQSGDKLGGKDGVLTPLIKRILEANLEGELQDYLEEEKARETGNRRNGSGTTSANRTWHH